MDARHDRQLLGAAARGDASAFGELEALVGASLPRETPPRTPPLATHSVLKYATVEGAERYRRIMRVFYVEHRNFGLRLTPAEVGRKLLEHYDLDLDDTAVSQSLDRLYAWGAVSKEYDTSLARTARELRQ